MRQFKTLTNHDRTEFNMKSGKILIIGGYGHVGQTISTTLADPFPGKIIAAGRNLSRAEAFSRATGGKVLPLELDITSSNGSLDAALDGVVQVIMCLDQSDTRFVEQTLQRGIDYLDITAAGDFFATIEKLDPLAKSAGSTAVISVGLAPGLTNLLAAQAAATLDKVNSLDISILLGMGDAHGDAAIQWTLENILADFTVIENGQPKAVSGFSDGKKINFPGFGKRTAYRFNFPDQRSLPKTQGISSVSTRLGFDLEVVTNAFAFFKRAGFLRFLQSEKARRIVMQALKTLRFGSNQFVLKVDALGKQDGVAARYRAAIRGAGEARYTGLVAAEVAKKLYAGDYPAGVFHIDQEFSLHEIIDGIEGIQFSQEIANG